jgi:predicted DNA-binding transcriptional regulator AlpA
MTNSSEPVDPHAEFDEYAPCWTIADVAHYLRVPKSDIYYWRYSNKEGGGPPAMRIGRNLRWRPADVRAWAIARREE